MEIRKGIDEKLHVKPAYLHLIHLHAYEGPCRQGPPEILTTEYDGRLGEQKFAQFQETLATRYTDDVKMLEPTYLTWNDDFVLREPEMKRLLEDVGDTDLFLFDGVFHQFPASEIAVRYKKPVGVIGCCASTDATAALRAKGLEAYGYVDPDHASQGLSLLRVKKAIQRTNVLVALKNDIISKGVLSTIVDLEGLKQDLGVRFTYINAEELLDDVANLPRDGVEEALQLTDRLIRNAEQCHLSQQAVLDSAKFYVGVKRMLVKYECNAFTIPCFEICATRRLDREKYTFCLAHSLLKDEGIPSACEADINVLMAMNVLINLTRIAPHMGNVHPLAHEAKMDHSTPSGLEIVPEIEGQENVVSIFHAVPTIQMKGIGKEPVPYEIRNFTYGGWGASLRYDYNRDKGATITLLRFHPTGKKMMATRGRILAGAGFNTVGCPTGFYFQVDNVKDFFEKELEFGHHHAWVFGDYLENLRDLGKILGVEVVTA